MTRELKDLMSFNEKTVDFNCDKHGLQKCKIIKFSQDWTKPYCKLCEEDRKVEEAKREEERKKRQQAEAKRARIESLLRRSMIPSRFSNYTFETYIAKSDDQKRKKEFCQKYSEDFENVYQNGTSLVFCGTTGTGKTHLACAIANAVITRLGSSAVFMSVIRAIRQVKETYSKSSEKTEQEAIDWFLNPDLLILDEVGVQFGTDAEKVILFEILNERYQNRKPTILISNLAPKPLTEYIGDRVMDRMKDDNGSVLQFKWESHRGKILQNIDN